MKQHNSDEFVDFSKLSQGEIAMHQFRQYDLDADGRVDGLEFLKKIQKDAREDGYKNVNVSDTLVNIVDNVMDQYDENWVGYTLRRILKGVQETLRMISGCTIEC